MAAPDRTAPPAAPPDADENTGYADPNPRDGKDARLPDPRRPNPDTGGLDREPETKPGAADE